MTTIGKYKCCELERTNIHFNPIFKKKNPIPVSATRGQKFTNLQTNTPLESVTLPPSVILAVLQVSLLFFFFPTANRFVKRETEP